MEALLSLSFSNISSRDALKIKKGLRQIEGLLAQICLSSSNKAKNHKRASLLQAQEPSPTYKQLDDLPNDPAFCEFFRLQDGFECNVTTHLITCLERLLSMPPSTTNDNLLLSALNLLQGMLLLHPPSRALFSREIHMNLLLDLLPPTLPRVIQCATLATLTICLMQHPTNTRILERADGLLAVSALLRESETSNVVKRAALEFLYFYLLPEDGHEAEDESSVWEGTGQTGTARKIRNRNGSGEAGASSAWGGDTTILEIDERSEKKSVRDKQRMLSKYFGGVDGLPAQFEAIGVYDGVVAV